VRLLLDTNALVRWHLEKLRPAAVRTVRRADLVAVSAISAWEIAIKRALGKLDRGDYGKCETCGKEIAEARLEAMPAARYCIDHA